MFDGHYDEWKASRMNGVKKYISPEYFDSKTLLELGCGYADLGNKFHEMGAIVTSSDARSEHLEIVAQRYPHIKTLLIDCDNEVIQNKYDIIVHWGLLYHLCEIEKHLEMISENCDLLLLETEIADSDDPTFFISVSENGYDQAFHKQGIRPSPTYVEHLLEKNGFHYKLIVDPILDSPSHRYTCELTNSKTWRHGLRRFWICWKNIPSPI